MGTRRVSTLLVLGALLALPPAARALPGCPDARQPREVASGLGYLEAVTSDHRGRLFASDLMGNRLWRIDRPGAQPELLTSIPGPAGLDWDRDGTLVVGSGNSIPGNVADTNEAGLSRVDPDTGATSAIVASGLSLANGVVRAPDASIYATSTFSPEGGRIDRVRDGKVERDWARVPSPNGLAIDRAGRNLFSADTSSPRVFRIPIDRPADHRLQAHALGDDDGNIDGFDGLTIDAADRLYLANNSGGEVWRVEGERMCVLARGLRSPSAVGFGGGGAGFPAENLYAVQFTGHVMEIPNATDRPPAEGAPLPLRLTAAPGSATAGRATRFVFTVTATDRGTTSPIDGAVVRFAGRRVRTDARGVASVTRSVAHARVLPANTTKPGYEAGRTSVRIERRKR